MRPTIMAMNKPDYTQQLHDEIDQTPEEYRALLLRIVHSFREGVINAPVPKTEDWFTREVQKGVEAADAGRLVEHAAVKAKWEAKRAAQLD